MPAPGTVVIERFGTEMEHKLTGVTYVCGQFLLEFAKYTVKQPALSSSAISLPNQNDT